MAAVVAFLNSKGGPGKTTLATNVGGCLHRRGHSVLIVDADPQGSARDWCEARPEDIDLPPVVGVDRPMVHLIASLGKAYDYVVIDGAARMERVTASAIRAADLVLIPVQPSGFDLWAVESLVESIQARRLVAEGRPGAAFVVSCQIGRSRLARSMDAALAPFGLPVLKARTTRRVAYAEAIGYGVTVLDLVNGTKAAAEVEAITDELLEMLSDEEDQPGHAPHPRSPEHAAQSGG